MIPAPVGVEAIHDGSTGGGGAGSGSLGGGGSGGSGGAFGLLRHMGYIAMERRDLARCTL